MENIDKKKTGKRKWTSIIRQVAAFFAIAVLVTGIMTYITQRVISTTAVRRQIESVGKSVAKEVMLSIKEYPAYEWLMEYWYEHSDELDVEYDVDYYKGTATEQKCKDFLSRHPDMFLKYLTTEQVNSLDDRDKKLYAEIIYSWTITRINQIKRTFDIDYLFCVMSDDTYKTQFFLLSAADEGAVRGDNYEEVYKLGKVVSIEDNESQQSSMRDALVDNSHLASAGNYVDYYSYLGDACGRHVFIGMTYNLSDIRRSIIGQTARGTINAMVLQIVLSIICLVLLFYFVLIPLRNVQRNIRIYKKTKDSDKVAFNLSAIRSHNEIEELAEDVVEMSREVESYVNEIEIINAEKQRISAELDLASKIQANTLPNQFPPFPDRREFDIYASMTPAKEVGGDFYDFFMLDDNHLGLVIADVSGKGVPAALFMMISMIQVHNAAENYMSPGKLLEIVNDQICSRNPEEMFVSVWMGILNITTGLLTASNAGHEYPALKTPEGNFELLKDRHGFVVGGLANMKYEEYTVQLRPGSKIFVYTDGVPEATDSEKKMFGTKRMIEALNIAPEESPRKIIRNVKNSIDEFVKDAEQFDDLTMMCVTYNGSNWTREYD